MSESRPKQFVAVLDFGAQYGQLIARRVRDLNVYSEIVPCDISADELRELNPSALDVTTQAQIVRHVMELRDEYNTSIIMVTHNMGVATYMSDYIIVMKDGNIVDEGDRNHILKESESEYTKTLIKAVPSMGGERYV